MHMCNCHWYATTTCALLMSRLSISSSYHISHAVSGYQPPAAVMAVASLKAVTYHIRFCGHRGWLTAVNGASIREQGPHDIVIDGDASGESCGNLHLIWAVHHHYTQYKAFPSETGRLLFFQKAAHGIQSITPFTSDGITVLRQVNG